MKYKILAADRKTIINRIEELTEMKPVYTGAPKFFYELDGLTIMKNEIETTDDSNQAFMDRMIDEGLLEAEGDQSPDIAPESGEPDEAGDEPANDEGSAGKGTDGATAANPDADDSIKPTYAFPLASHTPETLASLICILYSKGALMSKSTGGDFYASDALIERIKVRVFETTEEMVEFLSDASDDDLRGIEFEDGKVIFSGFPETDDSEVIKAWMTLAEYTNHWALNHKVLPRRDTEQNEKYSCRLWTTKIGIAGPKFKKERSIYYRNLTGSTAFRTDADREHWNMLQAKRIERRKAAEAAKIESENAEESEANEEVGA